MQNSITQALARYAVNLQYEQIPSNVIDYAKEILLDSVANMVGGITLKPAQVALDYYSDLGGREDATVLATGKKLPGENAAYLNSFFSNTLDYDDAFISLGHPGATIVPPIMAIAEQEGKSGKDILTAIVAAYEVNIRIAEAIIPSMERFSHVYGTGPNQSMGAAVAAGKIKGFTEEQMRHMFSYGAYHAPLPFANKVGMQLDERLFSSLKNNYGWIAKGAVLSAHLIEQGLKGNYSILDGDINGFWVMSGSDRCRTELYTKGLHDTYRILETEFKPYSSCRWSHPSIEAAENIVNTYPLDTAQISSVAIQTITEAKVYLPGHRPQDTYEAQFTLAYLVALTLSGKSPRKGLQEADVLDPAILSLSEKVSVSIDPAMDQAQKDHKFLQASMTVALQNGETYSTRVEHVLGSVNNPFSKTQKKEKFFTLVSGVLGQKKAEKLYQLVQSIDQVDDIGVEIQSIFQ